MKGSKSIETISRSPVFGFAYVSSQSFVLNVSTGLVFDLNTSRAFYLSLDSPFLRMCCHSTSEFRTPSKTKPICPLLKTESQQLQL